MPPRRINTGWVMSHTWYVTFEVQKRGVLPKRRSARLTKTFETEMEAKHFASTKLDEGLTVFAGTINPYLPRQVIPSGSIAHWLEVVQESDSAKLDDAQAKESS